MKPNIKQISPWICEIEWKKSVSDQLLQEQLAYKSYLEKDFSNEIEEIRIGFRTLAISFHKPLNLPLLKNWIDLQSVEVSKVPLPEKIWQIPVCYSLKTGRDLETLASSKNLTTDELIELHTKPLYRLHFYGFLPGFMYLNGLPQALHSPRKSIPDRVVPAGSLAIGATQTGIYPASSPGGWHLIGQTPILLFNPRQAKPVFAEIGEQIEFVPVSYSEFEQLKKHPQKPKLK